MLAFILAVLAALLFLLHVILWSSVTTYRDNRLLGVAGLLVSAAVMVQTWPFG